MSDAMNKPISNWGTQPRRKRTPNMLSAGEELHLLRAWQQRGDQRAREKVITAFSPMAGAMAKRALAGSQTAEADLLQQANIGLMKAADRFDLDRGYRFSTYAVWWVRAEIQDYKLANRSIVRRPNSADLRKSIANLSRIDEAVSNDPSISKADADTRVARALGVSPRRLNDLREQVSGLDFSLNVPSLGDDGDDRIARLVDPVSMEDADTMNRHDIKTLRALLVEMIGALPDREREIIVATQLQDPPATLEVLGIHFGISRERVRQLRERGFERLRTTMGQRDLEMEYFV
ncbi:sigma-70 family RNA polymerase sigma factor [Roseovarius tolerans]|nr:sigma-70 family RNA polymerase sigma factor [Roseovarius tolerans]